MYYMSIRFVHHREHSVFYYRKQSDDAVWRICRSLCQNHTNTYVHCVGKM